MSFLTVKDNKDQHVKNMWPKVGLQIFYNATMTRLIHKTLCKAANTKLFSSSQSQLMK